MLHCGIYECLGWPIDIQLKRVKESIVPQIHNNVDLYTSVIRKTVELCNHSLVSILRMAIGESEALCSNLINIEHFDYGPTTTFSLCTVIKEYFDHSNLKMGSLGEIPIHVDYFFGNYNDVKVSMDQKGFCKYFLENMIKNLKDHAFKEIDALLYSQKEYEDNDSWWTKLVLRLLPRLLPHRLAKRIDIMLRPVSPSTQILEKTVRIRIKPDKNDLHKVNLIIENNGKPFIGDTEKVFENGFGEGSGIGLYSAKQFLKEFGATIEMFTDNSNEYKVGFIINLPIL
jgi:signal transduction histidine kinase